VPDAHFSRSWIDPQCTRRTPVHETDRKVIKRCRGLRLMKTC
jgi:hypothetical protein